MHKLEDVLENQTSNILYDFEIETITQSSQEDEGKSFN